MEYEKKLALLDKEFEIESRKIVEVKIFLREKSFSRGFKEKNRKYSRKSENC